VASFPLNSAQRAAVEHHNGPLLVLAGAGSGKTRVITQRIARLLERGVPARAVVALTFTNKAAGEMKERVASLVKRRRSKKQDDPTISTFHSFGLGVLSDEKKRTGEAFTIFDQGDCLAAVKEILARSGAGRAFDAAAVLARISNAKNAFLGPDELPNREGDDYDAIAKIVYPRYQEALKSFRAYDFDDLVCEVVRLWTDRPDVRRRFRDRYRYILVDEYQDTNHAQLRLLRLLAEPHRNICVVGDDDQSIYAWRGADVRNILEFEEHFPGATVVKLEQNYRSRMPILAVANAVIEKRPAPGTTCAPACAPSTACGAASPGASGAWGERGGKHRKVLFTDRPGGDKPRLAVAPAPEAEAAFVASEIRRLVCEEGVRPREVAVLFRSNGQSQAVEEALREQGIAHRVVGGQQFYERKEVKDLLAYMKLSMNRADEISLRRIVNVPARGIGQAALERLTQHALAKGWSLWQAIERAPSIDGLSSAARDGCAALEHAISETRKRLLVERAKASLVARAIVDETGLKRDIEAGSPSVPAAARRVANLESLIQTFARREASGRDSGESLAAFLHTLTLDLSDGEEDTPHEIVTLSTLHGAKGLEFEVVFLIGCEEGLLPHARTLDARATDATPQDIEEERRLFYVGVTRARERLTLSRSKGRVMRGKPTPRTPSRFLSDIPAELVDEIEVTGKPMTAEATSDSAGALLAALASLGS
jgi:DNA helicase-2/ATP-dependent DNA helicase PcrA